MFQTLVLPTLQWVSPQQAADTARNLIPDWGPGHLHLGWTDIQLSAHHCHDDLVDFILNKAAIKADPNLKDTKTMLTPLCSAIN